MVQSRVGCALALLCFAACSFPEYRLSSEPQSEPPAGPTCVDGMRNGDETGVDCGGASCSSCPTCDDELQNGDESDVDCGGTCGARCETDERCREAADCGSLICDRVCQPSSCQDEVRNGAETGVDCGGGCSGCSNGSACKSSADCLDRRCQDQVCVSAGCTDGVVNGSESDADCGGADCAPCEAGLDCELAEDCDSQVCTAGSCVASTCSDSTRNQGESDVDCGGAVCGACDIGKRCDTAVDCASELCRNGTCVPEQPSGQALSSAQWKLSSSEAATQSGTSSAFDGVDGSAWTSGKEQYSGMYVDLDLGKTEIFFRALLKVTSGPYTNDFPGSVDVYVSSDGTFGTPTLTGLRGDQWMWCTFSGAQVGRYLRFVITQPKPLNWSIGEVQVLN